MRVVVQRVSKASVAVSGREVGRIGPGLVVLAGIEQGDSEREMAYMADKIINLRIFPDQDGKMNLGIKETGGQILSISQFTLVSRIGKGRRPDFGNAADPRLAERLFDFFNERLGREVPIEKGVFGAMMDVELINSGPVTFIIERSCPGAIGE